MSTADAPDAPADAAAAPDAPNAPDAPTDEADVLPPSFLTNEPRPATHLYGGDVHRPTLGRLLSRRIDGDDDADDDGAADEAAVKPSDMAQWLASMNAVIGSKPSGGQPGDGGDGGNRCKVCCRELCCASKFGWVTGVLVRCMLNIWGVIMFLRVGWIVSLAGLGLTTLVILISVFVTTMTSLSLSAIATNGVVKGGGAYYLISRSLGPAFGGAIGIVFSVANAVGVSLYLVGFAETVVDLYRGSFQLVDGSLWDVRIWGLISLTFLTIVAFINVSFAIKMQLVFLLVLIVSIVSFVVGSFTVTPSDALGITGMNLTTFTNNLGSDFVVYQGKATSIWTVLSVFFPAVTGIMAGANISGDLRDAQKALPKGTLLAVLITTIVYLLFAWLVGATVVRSSLRSNFLIMKELSLWGPLLLVGIFASTLSSALASLDGAPRVFQAVCKDELFPALRVFAKGYRKTNEPYPAYGLTLVIAIACILIGDLNAIAPLITNFFLISYGLINFACFASSVAKSPGWRPSFRAYHPITALLGAASCVGFMFLIDWITSIVTFAVTILLYLYITYRSPRVNWGSAGQAFTYVNALRSAFSLNVMAAHVKTYRPAFLVMTGKPSSRAHLLTFSQYFKSGRGLTLCGNVIVADTSDSFNTFELQQEARANNFLVANQLRAFQDVVVAPTFRNGAQSLFQLAGLGKIRPNFLLVGFKKNYGVASDADVDDYVNVLRDAFDMSLGVIVARNVELFPRVHKIRTVCGRSLACCFRRFRSRGRTRYCCSCLMPHKYVGVEMARFNPDMTGKGVMEAAETRADEPVIVDMPDLASDIRAGAPMTPTLRSPDMSDELGALAAMRMPTGPLDLSAPRHAREMALTMPAMRQRAMSSADIAEFFRPPEHAAPRIPTDLRRVHDPSETLRRAAANSANTTRSMPSSASSPRPHAVTIDEASLAAAAAAAVASASPAAAVAAADAAAAASPGTPLSVSFDMPPGRTLVERPSGTIDVYWLSDDGGLALLLAHLLQQHSYWQRCSLRVFTIVGAGMVEAEERARMARLLGKFRVRATIVVVPGGDLAASDEHLAEYSRVTGRPAEGDNRKAGKFVRLREIIEENSAKRDARLVLCTLYVPYVNLNNRDYLSWLDYLSFTRHGEAPLPIAFVRGNQEDVLTFYS